MSGNVNGFKVAESEFAFEKRLLDWKEYVCIVSLNSHKYKKILLGCSFMWLSVKIKNYVYLFDKIFQDKASEIDLQHGNQTKWKETFRKCPYCAGVYLYYSIIFSCTLPYP